MVRALPKVTLACQGCDKEFVVPGGYARDYQGRPARKYCSRKCYHAQNKPPPSFICERCGKDSPRRYNANAQTWDRQARFCSMKCAADAQRTGSIDKNGYRVYLIKGRQFLEHRLIMEYVLGRNLRLDETVHHRNGKRLDNRPENLELWCGRHGRGQRVEDQVAFAVEILSVYSEFLTEEQREALEKVMGGQEIPQKFEETVGHASSIDASDGEVNTLPVLGV